MYRVSDTPVLSRRLFLGGSAALLANSAAILPALARSPADFVASLWPEAQARGVSRRAFDAALGGFSPLDQVLELTRKQPEFTSTVADYIGKRVTDAQAGRGQAKAGEWQQTLAAVQQTFGVQPEIILGIWGNETNYGSFMGGTNTVHALATLTHGGYRASYFRKELLTALKIVSDGHVDPAQMVGSWAGAMGHPQFMPSSFMRYAVDFRGEGRADIWTSVPDALASAANYLKQHGWQAGETWGYEVKAPTGFDYRHAWSGTSTTLSAWESAGVRRVSGRPFPRPGDMARLYMPMGGHGPLFLVLANFDVIKRYNNSDSYALAVGHLADRILGIGGFAVPWPDDGRLTAAQRRELQSRLAGKGYALGTVDGVIGPRTREAIMAFQKRAGLLPDGHAGTRLLRALS